MSGADTDPRVLDEAAAWLMQLHSGTATEQDREAHRRWCEKHPAHAQAWQRAQSLAQSLQTLPAGVGRATLGRQPAAAGRRATLGKLAALMVGIPSGSWLAWRALDLQAWTADHRTATGQIRHLTLPDGTQVVLGTATALDLRFDERERLLVLRAGEVLVTTARDPSPRPRPLSVQTAQGRVLALGTRFTVRQHEDTTHVAVLEQAVDLQPARSPRAATRLRAGEQARFSLGAVETPGPMEVGATAWTQGMLVAHRMRLAAVLAELARYRPGVLRCDPALADLQVSGVYPLADTDRSLALLADTFSLRVRRRSRYWVSIERD